MNPGARGLRVGTALLDAIQAHARDCGLMQVRLDVIDSNPRARALYERHGFKEVATMSVWPLKPLFGFDVVMTMVKQVGVAAA